MLSISEAEARAAALVERAARPAPTPPTPSIMPMPRPGSRSASASSRTSSAPRARRSACASSSAALGERLLVRPLRRGAGGFGRARGGDGARGAGGSLVRPRARGQAAARARARRRGRRRRRSLAGRAQGARAGRSRKRGAKSPESPTAKARGASAGRTVIALATSHGFCRGYSTSGYSLGERDRRRRAARCSAIMPATASAITPSSRIPRRSAAGRRANGGAASPGKAAERDDAGAVRSAGRRLAARPFHRGDRRPGDHPPHQLPARQGGGGSVRRGRDDPRRPHRPRGLRSKPFDGEGLPTRPSNLVEAGRLTGWLLDSASARQLGRAPTGHAVRGGGGAPGVGATNVHMEPGSQTREQLIGEVERGVYVTELIGQGVNPVTGDYSRGASGFIIENGELGAAGRRDHHRRQSARHVREPRGGRRPRIRRAVNVPTLRIDGMTVAGA
jgi:hypothetical protein